MRSEDTSLDYIFDTFTVNGEGDCVVDRTSMQEAINSWHKEQQIKLIERIEGEVIGRDILMGNGTPVNHTLHNFRDRQRQTLKQIKERYE